MQYQGVGRLRSVACDHATLEGVRYAFVGEPVVRPATTRGRKQAPNSHYSNQLRLCRLTRLRCVESKALSDPRGTNIGAYTFSP